MRADLLGGFVAGEQRGEQGHQHEGDHDGEAEAAFLLPSRFFKIVGIRILFASVRRRGSGKT